VRKLLVTATAFTALLAAAPMPAHGQQSGFSRAEWTDPAPSGDRFGTPVAYLDDARPLTGVAVHQNGISSVNAILVPDPAAPPPDGCQATVEPNAVIDADGATFHVTATFPCNLVYEVRASAQSNPGSGIAAPPPESRAIPLLVAVAVPPAPVGTVDADVDGDSRAVSLSWPANGERDLLGYDVRRGGQSIGQVNAGDATRFTDTKPPAAGGDIRYEVVAYRQGPDDEVKQVPSRSTSVTVDVPRDPDAPAAAAGSDGGDEAVDPSNPQLAGQQHAASRSGTPLAGGMSSVRARGQAAPRLGTPTTLDTGFGETLPFDTSGQAAVGDPAVVAEFDDGGDLMDGKQKLAFIAGGLAVLVVAGMIFHVTRRAAREAY
jgi:hypothetical protein